MALSRYDGKPFLRLLVCYVLRAIGEIDAQQEAALRSLEPKLVNIYGHHGAWFELVARQMDFADDLPRKIKDIWEAGKAKAHRQGTTVDPAEFTRQFVDANFPT